MAKSAKEVGLIVPKRALVRRASPGIATVDPRASEAYGALREGVHVAGYTFERGMARLEWLLEGDRWRKVGFDDVNDFLAALNLDQLKIAAEQRKRIAARIKALQPKVSNRRIAKTLGVDEGTIRRAVRKIPHAPGKTPTLIGRFGSCGCGKFRTRRSSSREAGSAQRERRGAARRAACIYCRDRQGQHCARYVTAKSGHLWRSALAVRKSRDG